MCWTRWGEVNSYSVQQIWGTPIVIIDMFVLVSLRFELILICRGVGAQVKLGGLTM